MAAATLTSKGQVTLPARLRERLRLRPGSKIVFEEQPNGDFVVRKKSVDLTELRGMLKAPPGVRLSIEEMDDVVADAVVERYLRSKA